MKTPTCGRIITNQIFNIIILDLYIMTNTQKALVGKVGIFATRSCIVACLIQLTSLWLPVVQYKLQNPDVTIFVNADVSNSVLSGKM